MALKKNKKEVKKNSFKAKENKAKEKAASTKAKRTRKSPSFGGVVRFLKDPRTRRITGLLLILFGIYCTVAFTSFLFTWKVDQSVLSRPWWDVLGDKTAQVDNWLGRIGAMVSHLFIHEWFGIASFLFIPIFLLFGMRLLFKFKKWSLSKTTSRVLFCIIWLSLAFAFLVHSEDFRYLGGGLGYQLDTWTEGLVGAVGTGFLLLFSLVGFLLISYQDKLEKIGHQALQLFHYASHKLQRVKLASEKDEFHDTIGEQDNFSAADIAFQDDENDLVRTEAEEEGMILHPTDKDLNEDSGDDGFDHRILEDDDELDDDDSQMLPPEAALTDEELLSNSDDDSFSVEIPEQEQELSNEELDKKLTEFGEYDPKLDLSSYQMPGVDLLVNYGGGSINVSKEELEANKDRIVQTLANYKIGIEKIKATIGPTVTLYELVPEAGVRISRIKNLEDDIALSLAALGIRIIAPIPGRGTIGIEVPNSNPDIVSMRTVIASEKFQNSTMELPIALGKTISNETYIADLAKMPHLLMAGATGQGKSVGLNAILVSLLYKKHPAQVKFVLVDPKKVELTLFNKIERHFLAKLPGEEESIITDTSKVVSTLNSLCVEMDQRYELLKDAQVRNIKEYNAKFIKRKLNPENGHKFMPYIILVVDEFADLIMTAGKEVELPIARLAQLARAVGIHLIIATQRPSVNIITGTIKANFPARIAFRVSSKVDSRTILDTGGAEQLIGRGDMLLNLGSDVLRLQCAFVDTPEVADICDFIGNQRGYPEAFELPEYVTEDSGGGDSNAIDASDRDSMFEDAARIIVTHQQGSASLLQRKLKLGYNRAGRIVDQLEAVGIIGPFEGSKARQVLIPDLVTLEQLLNQLAEKVEN